MKKQLLSKLSALVTGVVAVMAAALVFLPNMAGAATPDVPYVPTVFTPAHGAEVTEAKPLITGVTLNDTEVAVYIDGHFNGKATVNNDASGTANFHYYPFLDLLPGWHTLQARAENPASGLRSEASTLTKFYVVDPSTELTSQKPYVPTLFAPEAGLSTVDGNIPVTGLTQNDMLVTVYVDGVFRGNARVINDASGTASFGYTIKDLAPGTYKVKVRAEHPTTKEYSDWSEQRMVTVQAPTPVPTLFEPVVNNDTTWDKPWIVGLTNKGLKVAVYIDGEMDGYADLEESEANVVSFKYKPSKYLATGWHKVWVVAIDGTDKASEQSITDWFYVSDPDAPVIVTETEDENTTATEEEEGEEGDTGGPTDEDLYVDDSEATDTEEGDSEEEVTEEGDDSEEAVDEEGEEGDEEADEESSDEEEEEAADSEEDGEKKTSRSTLIGWIILAAVAIALVWKGRKGMKSFFNEPELGGIDTAPKADTKPADKPKKDDKPKGDKKKDSGKKDGKKDSKKTPPPPPPASSF